MNAILTVAQAAERMNVSRQRMHILIQSYQLETSKVNGKLTVLHEAELKKIPNERRKRSASNADVAMINNMSNATIEKPIVDIDLGTLINQAIENGETATSIAKKANVALSVVSALRNGVYTSSPSLKHVQALLAALGYEIYVRPTQ